MTVSEWKQMSADVKSLDFAYGCILMQNQLVKFRCPARFGTVRSEVRIFSPRPIKINDLRPLTTSGRCSFVAGVWVDRSHSLYLLEKRW